ncbi:MAG TPA: type II toxin-antitoxin system VapC family toxin [Vicinamibacteria bacterium]|nr:type II toxin-antitoxin system VapC family toxin [Vicinamibacteria bacterium]
MRRVLLDTECWLWWHLSPERLNQAALTVFEERRSPLLLSAASSWEMAIKQALGKLDLPAGPERFVPEQMAEDGIDPLPIEHAHALRVGRLPPHHSDPFDRLLVAQAQLERCSLLTADAQLLEYEVDVLWAGQEPPPPRKRRRRSKPVA